MRYLITLSWFAMLCGIVALADAGAHNGLLALAYSTPYSDKLGHFFLYGVMAALTNWMLRHRPLHLAGLALPLGSVLVLAFALCEEASQAFFPSRTLDAADALANLAGVLAFSLLAWAHRPARTGQQVPSPLA